MQIKRLKFQIKQAIVSNKDFCDLTRKLEELEKSTGIQDLPISPYQLIPLCIKLNYPDYQQINKADPRYHTYKVRFLFGPDD